MIGPTNAGMNRGTIAKYSIDFNPSTFSTGANLSYADDLQGFVKLDNSLTIGSTINENIKWGSWQSLESNPLTKDCFYATVNGDGTIAHRLNPYDLSKAIDGTDVSSEITTTNVMFCIPTRYITRNANRISHSRDSAYGEAYAHTLEGTTYKYLCLGVYPSVNVSSVAKSISGSKPSANTKRWTFRNYSKANGSPSNGIWLQWNWHHYSLIRDMIMFATLDWDSQKYIGNGVQSGSQQANWKNNGELNSAGLFAGSQEVNHPVKAYLENIWSTCWQFIDDCVTTGGYLDSDGNVYKDIYAGQNRNPLNTTNETTNDSDIAIITSDKQLIGRVKSGVGTGNTSAGWKYGASIISNQVSLSSATQYEASTPDTSIFNARTMYGQMGWGLPDSWGGSTTTYSHDGYYTPATNVSSSVPANTTARNVLVGGISYLGLNAGLSALDVASAVGTSVWNFGSRLAFVCDW